MTNVTYTQEFKCEICGNASYWGRRAFERHFKEYRHQNGMRALGIPNSKLFFEVTQIAEAQHLWKNVQARHEKPSVDWWHATSADFLYQYICVTNADW